MLLLDAPRLGQSVFKGPEAWAASLNQKLKAEKGVYTRSGLMISSIDRWLPQQLSIVTDDNVPPEMRDATRRVADRLDMTHSKLR